MNKHYSILHISDLHKGENNDFDHLFASLCNDADSYDQDIPAALVKVDTEGWKKIE